MRGKFYGIEAIGEVLFGNLESSWCVAANIVLNYLRDFFSVWLLFILTLVKNLLLFWNLRRLLTYCLLLLLISRCHRHITALTRRPLHLRPSGP